MIDIHKLRIFCAVIDAQSFSLAATQLRLSQPVVSAHVRQLEAAAGAALIDRAIRPVGPTDSGKRLHDSAKKLLDEMNEVEMLISDMRSNKGERGRVLVSATGMLTSAVLPPLVQRFRELHPAIDVRVRAGNSREVIQQTFTGQSHLGLLISVEPPKPLLSKSAGPIELVLVKAADKARPERRRSCAEVVRQEGLVVPAGTMQFLAVVEKMLKKYGIAKLPVRHHVGSWEAAKLTVLRGTGVTILPRPWVTEEIARQELEELKFEGSSFYTGVYVTCKRQRALPEPVQRFRRFLLDEISHATRVKSA